jgi:hypothetical protein
MSWEMMAGLLRHLLTFGGGFAVAKGWFDEATMNSLVAALLTIVGVGWSVIAKRKP